MNIQRVKEKLQEIVGKSVSDRLVDLKIYARDSSPVEGKTNLVVWPNNQEQLRRLIRLSALRGYQLTLRGGGYGNSGACVPQDSIVVDMSYFDKIIELDRNENSVIVECGVNIEKLNEKLGKVNLYFPIEHSNGLHTIGGLIASNEVGWYSHKYGKVEDWIMWLEVIDASGKELKTENINNFVGREGATGVIVRAKLKLIKSINDTSATLLKFKTSEDMLKSLENLRNNKYIIALEYIDKPSSRLLGWEETHYLFIEYLDGSGEIKDKKEIEILWKVYNSIIPKWKAKKLSHDFSPEIPKSKIQDYLLNTRKSQIPTIGSIGIGMFHSFAKQEQAKALYEQIKLLQGKVNSFGQLKKQFLSELEIEELKELKHRYDPSMIMNKANLP